MPLDLLQEFEVLTEFIRLKFGITPKTSSIKNTVFQVYINTATPTVVADPFLPIDLTNNYNSISKILSLYWKPGILIPQTSYKVIISSLYDAAGSLIPSTSFYFTTGSSVIQEEANLPPPEEPIEIDDHSIRSKLFTNTTSITESNPDFYIISVDPENQDFYLPTDYNNGQIAIKFSSLPNGLFLNNNYFKVQKKKIQRNPSRWQVITANIMGDSSSGTVYINLPSLDATPVFNTPEKTYFEPQTRYRIIISKDVGIQ